MQKPSVCVCVRVRACVFACVWLCGCACMFVVCVGMWMCEVYMYVFGCVVCVRVVYSLHVCTCGVYVWLVPQTCVVRISQSSISHRCFPRSVRLSGIQDSGQCADPSSLHGYAQ